MNSGSRVGARPVLGQQGRGRALGKRADTQRAQGKRRFRTLSPQKAVRGQRPSAFQPGRTHSVKLAYPGCRITSSYKAFCRLDRRHFSTCSYFFVSCFSTSLLVLLRIKGCVT